MSRSLSLKGCSTRLLPQLPAGTIIQIEPIDSTTNANIQIADWISSSLARYFEKKHLGEEIYQILKNNLLKEEGKELFQKTKTPIPLNWGICLKQRLKRRFICGLSPGFSEGIPQRPLSYYCMLQIKYSIPRGGVSRPSRKGFSVSAFFTLPASLASTCGSWTDPSRPAKRDGLIFSPILCDDDAS